MFVKALVNQNLWVLTVNLWLSSHIISISTLKKIKFFLYFLTVQVCMDKSQISHNFPLSPTPSKLAGDLKETSFIHADSIFYRFIGWIVDLFPMDLFPQTFSETLDTGIWSKQKHLKVLPHLIKEYLISTHLSKHPNLYNFFSLKG